MQADRASVLAIVASNVLSLAIAWWEGWSLLLLLWPYWLQSVAIGWYSYRRIRALRHFRTDGFRVNGKTVEPTEATKRTTANFFLVHYGGFHLAYLVFLSIFTGMAYGADGASVDGVHIPPIDGRDLLLALGLGLTFFWTHRTSFRRNLEADTRGEPNIGTLMFLPYARVLPMHIMVIVGMVLASTWALLLFGSLKTVADVLMHRVEHRWLAKQGVAAA